MCRRDRSGNDQLIIWTLLAGGTGGIAGCANVYPHTMASIYNLYAEGKIEEAKAANASIASFRACFKYGNPNTIVKTAVRLLGYEVGPVSYTHLDVYKRQALNRDLGKQVVGFEENALKLLVSYDYPYNRTQFKRILKEAALRT